MENNVQNIKKEKAENIKKGRIEKVESVKSKKQLIDNRNLQRAGFQTESVAEQAAKRVAEQAAKRVTEQAAKRVTEQSAEQTAERTKMYQKETTMHHQNEWSDIDEMLRSVKVRQKELDELIRRIKMELKHAPEGTLQVIRKRRSFQYYHVSENKTGENDKIKYIKSADRKLASRLAQKEYARKVLKAAKQDEMCIQKMSGLKNREYYRKIFCDMHAGKQVLINPYDMSDEEYASMWLAEKKRFKEEYENANPTWVSSQDKEIITEQGERVKSKSEKILADKLFSMGIPYVYEMPVYLEGFGYIKPDFIVLNKRTREERYLEHFGLMDRPEYSEKAVMKIESFERNGIFPGEGLLLTYETSNHSVDMQIVELILRRYLL